MLVHGYVDPESAGDLDLIRVNMTWVDAEIIVNVQQIAWLRVGHKRMGPTTRRRVLRGVALCNHTQYPETSR